MEKECKIIFTKNDEKDIIEKKYSPSNEINIFHEREGLLMKETKDIIKDIVLELSKRINRNIFQRNLTCPKLVQNFRKV